MPDPDLARNHPPDRHAAALSNSLRSLSLKTSTANLKPSAAPRTISRRASSLEIRSGASSSASSAPSTPTIRKRASLASLSSVTGTMEHTGTPRRRGSVLSLRGSPSDAGSPPPSLKDRVLTPPPQDPYAETAVILHDSSYKHRYLRPKTGALEMESIVERPERIPAAVLGICAAQVRAGKERLSINKSTRLGKLNDPEVMLVHAHTPLERGKKCWPEELVGMCNASGEKLKKGQVEVPAGYHQGDLYLCAESLEDLEGCVGAVYDGVDAVFGEGPVKKAFVCIRPPGHHCAEREPSGFCWLNNVHIAIAHAAKEHGLSHAVILDFDLHHGDGSQAIAWSINELAESGSTAAKKTQGLHVPSIGYFSLHDINSYPCEYGDTSKIQSASINLEGAHGQYIHNVHLKPYGTHAQFWQLYDERYRSLFSKARDFLITSAAGKQRKNRAFSAGVFLSAGFDASEYESHGMQRHNVNVPTDFFAKFTADAVDLANELCEGRIVSVLEGGYSDRALTSGVFAHISGLSCVQPDEAGFVPTSISLAPSWAERKVAWDVSWWSIERIEELEKLLNKPTPVRERKQTSFMDPTAASAARVADVPRRVSNSFHSLCPSPAPPPPKPWHEQAVELSQHFIPQYEESKPIPAVAKETKATPRQSLPSTSNTRTLRERKPKPAGDDKNTRRTTVAGPISTATSRAPSRAGTPALPKGPPVTVASVGATVAGPRQPARKASTTALKKTPSPPPTASIRKVSAPLPAKKTPTPPPPAARRVSTSGPVISKTPSPKSTISIPKVQQITRTTQRVQLQPAFAAKPVNGTGRRTSVVGTGTPPSSPPVIEVNGVVAESSLLEVQKAKVGDNGLGFFHGVVGSGAPIACTPGVFTGGEIKFGGEAR
ncbi:histone deacetylase domain-containing protein [Sphaerosporella brunnea]|uniref:Histone deacetylase domain-containing protein n=1 Tax=Sphaerosporella brunnea TaxID=1250544 RepID=A0A5J5F4D6_9PEZI|nr:histone deacetylase domain-containing protein [Sphaerosporella brunnea]